MAAQDQGLSSHANEAFRMKIFLILFSTVLLLSACKRRTPAAPATPPASASQPPPEPTPKAVAPASPPAGGSSRIVAGDQNLPALNAALKAYVAKHKKAPAKLEDLAKDGFISFVPFAPPGMRYELDAARGEVRLVNPMAK